MKVIFDDDGYVEMLVMKGDLPNSIELEDDDTIDMKYITCYRLGFDDTKLVLDAEKVQRMENNLRAKQQIYDLKKQLDNSDFKVLRHLREKTLGIKTTLTKGEFVALEAEREAICRRIREIEDSADLETDVNAIAQEGVDTRTAEEDHEETVKEMVSGYKKQRAMEQGAEELPSI